MANELLEVEMPVRYGRDMRDAKKHLAKGSNP
jgi:hypothetical protein